MTLYVKIGVIIIGMLFYFGAFWLLERGILVYQLTFPNQNIVGGAAIVVAIPIICIFLTSIGLAALGTRIIFSCFKNRI